MSRMSVLCVCSCIWSQAATPLYPDRPGIAGWLLCAVPSKQLQLERLKDSFYNCLLSPIPCHVTSQDDTVTHSNVLIRWVFTRFPSSLRGILVMEHPRWQSCDGRLSHRLSYRLSHRLLISLSYPLSLGDRLCWMLCVSRPLFLIIKIFSFCKHTFKTRKFCNNGVAIFTSEYIKVTTGTETDKSGCSNSRTNLLHPRPPQKIPVFCFDTELSYSQRQFLERFYRRVSLGDAYRDLPGIIFFFANSPFRSLRLFF